MAEILLLGEDKTHAVLLGVLLREVVRAEAPGALAGWLLDDAIVVAKHFWKTPLPERPGLLVLVRGRRFGETALSVYRRDAVTTAGGE